MSDILNQLYNDCDPYKPADSKYYLNCAEVQGNNALSQRYLRHLARATARTTSYCCFLFSGHIGCGKSSELEQLKHALAISKSKPSHARYFPVLLDASEYLNEQDVTVIDILLAIVTELADTLRQEADIELKDSFFKKLFEGTKRSLLIERELKGVTVLGAKVEIQKLAKNPDAREIVRNALQPKLSAMQEEISTILEAHVIYTIPLRLARSDGPQLEQHYGVAPFVLPMIKVRERGNHKAPYEPGLKHLRDLLKKRIEPYSLNQVFNPDALEFLLIDKTVKLRTMLRPVGRLAEGHGAGYVLCPVQRVYDV